MSDEILELNSQAEMTAQLLELVEIAHETRGRPGRNTVGEPWLGLRLEVY
jgi:hypothetical protein